MGIANVHPVLAGRQAELALLADFARQACAGRGVVALIEGEPGIGKTVLLHALADDCAALGMRVAGGAAEVLEQRLPFAAVGACLGLRGSGEASSGRAAALLRGEGAFGQSTAALNHELAVTEAILDLVDGWCAEGPVALIIDDAQWADPASVVVLNQLARGAPEQRLLLIISLQAATRRDDIGALVRGLTGAGAHLMNLGPLNDSGVEELLRGLLDAPAGPALRSLVAGAGGNPLYIFELVAALSRENAIHTVDGVAEVTAQADPASGGRVPSSLAEILMHRWELLPRKTGETLQLAAALGPALDAAELSATLDMSLAEVFETIRIGTDAGLLVEAGGQVVFRHGLIREVAAAQVPVSVRTALHLRASDVLRAGGAPVERVAERLSAGTAMDREAIGWLIGNADRLIVRAPELAVVLLRRALAGVDTEPVAELRFQLTRALLWEGNAPEAEQVARTALAADSGGEREGSLRWLLAQACYRQGRLAETLEVAREAIASSRLSVGEIGRFQGFLALCHTLTFQFPETIQAASEAIRLGEAADDPVATGYGLCLLSGVDLVQGDYAHGIELADRAIAAFGGGVQPDLQMDPYYLRGFCLSRLDRFTEADESLAISERQNLERGGIYAALSSLVRTQMRVMDGRWDDALTQIHTTSEGFDPYNYRLPMRSLAAIVAIHRGTLTDPAEIPVDDGSAGARSARNLMVWAQALAEETRTGPRQALDLLYPIWTGGGVMEHPGGIYDLCPDLARLASAAQDTQRARELAVSTEALATALPNPTTRAIAALCAGIANEDAELLGEAADGFRQASRPLFEAYAWEHQACLLGQAGEIPAARLALDHARLLYSALDAAWDVSRADARLRRLGIRRGVTGPRKRPKNGWEALTETEAKVALLVADGRSNPEIAGQMFLSRRTIQSHVSSILAKLGLKSRVEIAISAHRRAPV